MSQSIILSEYADEVNARENTNIILHTDDKMIFQIECVEGTGEVEVVPLFAGIVLQFHTFHCKNFQLVGRSTISAESDFGAGLKLNFCSEGRVEVKMSDNSFLFMDPGLLCLDTRKSQNNFSFPCGHYHGLELYIHKSAIDANTPKELSAMGIDLKKILSLYCNDEQSYVIRADSRLRALFQAIYDAPPECRVEYFRIKIAELLCLFQYSNMPEKSNNSYLMTMGQVEIAKQAMEIITKDLSQHYSIESMAAQFGISASSLKNYFQGVYGKNISSYLFDMRMSIASTKLKETNKPISEIASEVGYENASKFSAAFKRFIGETPLEYRRQSRCGI